MKQVQQSKDVAVKRGFIAIDFAPGYFIRKSDKTVWSSRVSGKNPNGKYFQLKADPARKTPTYRVYIGEGKRSTINSKMIAETIKAAKA